MIKKGSAHKNCLGMRELTKAPFAMVGSHTENSTQLHKDFFGARMNLIKI